MNRSAELSSLFSHYIPSYLLYCTPPLSPYGLDVLRSGEAILYFIKMICGGSELEDIVFLWTAVVHLDSNSRELSWYLSLRIFEHTNVYEKNNWDIINLYKEQDPRKTLNGEGVKQTFGYRPRLTVNVVYTANNGRRLPVTYNRE